MVALFEWTARDEPTYGNFGKVYMAYVSDMHIGSVRVIKPTLLAKADVVCVMHKRTENVWRCPDGIEQGKAWVQSEFLGWFLSCNKIAHAWLRENAEAKDDQAG